MNNSIEKPSRTRRFFVFFALFMVLIALPAGSYLYMKSGLSWRKKAQDELRIYGKVFPAFVIYPDGAREDELKDKVCVIYFFGEHPDLTPENKRALDVSERLCQQFGYKSNSMRDDFRLAMITLQGTTEFRSYAQKLPTAELVNWVWNGAMGSWTTILSNGYESFCKDEGIKPAQSYFALADADGTIRRFYDANDEKQIGRMVEHIAMLLPQK